jgi:carbon-monoxide dehydrogenase large subunit
MGAYLSTFAPATPTWLHGTLMAGNYKTPNVYVNVKAVFTNTVPVDAYRGAGRPEATFQLERVIDKAARELGVDPVELRRKNFVTEFPYATPVAVEYDTGELPGHAGQAAEEIADWRASRRAAPKARRSGKLRGLGLNCYIEACGIAPSNLVGQLGARAGLYDAPPCGSTPPADLVVMTGATATGRGTRRPSPRWWPRCSASTRAWSRSCMATPPTSPMGMGTYGSRSLAVCGSAMVRATEKIIAKAKKIAAHLLEASEGRYRASKDGAFSVAGTDKSVAWGDVALAAYVPHNYPLEDSSRGWRRRRSTTRQLHLPGGRLCLRGRGRSRDRQGRPSRASPPPTISATSSTR